MSGICGWLDQGGQDAPSTLAAMASRFAWQGHAERHRLHGSRFALAAEGAAGTAGVFESGPIHVAVQGHPAWIGAAPAGMAAFCERLVALYLERGERVLEAIGGDFALAIVDERTDAVVLAIDRIGVRNIVYQASEGQVLFGASSDVVNAHPHARREVAPQALYDYVYFHMVPGPDTVFQAHKRVMAGHFVRVERGHAKAQAYWQMRFDEHQRSSVAQLAPAFRAVLRTGVSAYSEGASAAAFLSGGTDSSTIAGTLVEVNGTPARTYSIGFEAAGYDEMEYARIAARHFRTDHHEYYVTPADVVAAVPRIAAAYDQPFGNASAVPTYCCARFARADGVERMLGGDGGDELFGGNSRYAKQVQLAMFSRLPRAMRATLAAVLLSPAGELPVSVVRKARSYVEQARLSMPARYETYNLLERLGPANVFAADFLATVDRGRPLALLTGAYESTQAESLINRMLALDLKFTLADNDLPKVTRTCDMAGVDVAFPLLHESVVDFSASLAPDFKLRGTRLRYFFKEALRDFLPPEIIAKEKHGFGLPAGPWLRDYGPLRELAGDSLASLHKRGIFRGDLLDALQSERFHEHAGYYGTLTWVLMMLELWFQNHASD